LAAALAFLTFGFTVRRQGDLWWHLAAGRWMWEQRSLPWVDPWSFTRAGQPWLHHEWLADLVYEAWVRAFGMESLVYWKWAVVLATFLLLLRLLHRMTDSVVASGASAALAIATAAPFLDLRPHLYSLLGYLLVLSCLFLHPRLAWSLPLLFAVWVNLHGGFFFGLMALTVVLAVTSWWSPPPPPERLRVGAVWLGCLLGSLVNPYGLRAFGYPLKYAFDTTSPFRALLTEWSSPFAPGGVEAPLHPLGLALGVVAIAVALVTGSYRDRRGLGLASVALTALTLAMSLTSRRFIPLFAVTQSLLVASVLAWLVRSAPRGWQERLGHPALRAGAPIAIAGWATAWLVAHPPLPRMFSILTAEDTFPVGVTRFIAAHRLSGDVFAQWSYGGYLQLHAPGLMRVYVDQRADTVFDADTYRRYLQVNGQRPGWTSVVESSGAQYFWWPRYRASLAPLLGSGRWRILHEDQVSVLLVRSDVPLPPGLTAGAPPR
jgi:hypothetical protein